MPGIISGERRLEHRELKERSARAAAGLRSLGVGVGDAVALLMRNDFAFLEASSAAGLLGAYPVAVNWHSTAAEAEYVLADCGAQVLVIHSDLLPAVRSAVPAGVVTLVVETPPEILHAYGLGLTATPERGGELQWNAWLAEHQPLTELPVEAPGAMIYTSGTSGRPKGVRRSAPNEAQAEGAAEVIATAYGLRQREHPSVALVTAPLYHSAPIMHATRALQIGATVVIQSRFDAEEALELIERWGVTHAYFAPIMFNRLLQLPDATRRRYDLSSLEFVVHAAARCPPEIKRAMIEWWGPIIHEFYGSTETRAVTTCTSQEWLERPGAVGRALPSAVLRIVGAGGQTLPAGETGEIICAHPGLADFTYHGDDAKRRSADRDGLFATGDIGYLDKAGYLFICDRASDMIISGGVNIYPAEIEAELLCAPGVLDCAVFGIPDDEYGEAVMAVVQSTEGQALDPKILHAHLRERLASYKTPRKIEQIDLLPREESGKIFKRKLRDSFWRDAQRRI